MCCQSVYLRCISSMIQVNSAHLQAHTTEHKAFCDELDSDTLLVFRLFIHVSRRLFSAEGDWMGAKYLQVLPSIEILLHGYKLPTISIWHYFKKKAFLFLIHLNNQVITFIRVQRCSTRLVYRCPFSFLLLCPSRSFVFCHLSFWRVSISLQTYCVLRPISGFPSKIASRFWNRRNTQLLVLTPAPQSRRPSLNSLSIAYPFCTKTISLPLMYVLVSAVNNNRSNVLDFVLCVYYLLCLWEQYLTDRGKRVMRPLLEQWLEKAGPGLALDTLVSLGWIQLLHQKLYE